MALMEVEKPFLNNKAFSLKDVLPTQHSSQGEESTTVQTLLPPIPLATLVQAC